MAYIVKTTNAFDKALKRCVKRGLNRSLLTDAVKILAEKGSLPRKYKAHKLQGKYIGQWECHIQSDWLMIWEQNDTELTLLLLETGTHSDLF